MPIPTEHEHRPGHTYIPLSEEMVGAVQHLGHARTQELLDLGFSDSVLFMIRLGFARQLRDDAYGILAGFLGQDDGTPPETGTG